MPHKKDSPENLRWVLGVVQGSVLGQLKEAERKREIEREKAAKREQVGRAVWWGVKLCQTVVKLPKFGWFGWEIQGSKVETC